MQVPARTTSLPGPAYRAEENDSAQRNAVSISSKPGPALAQLTMQASKACRPETVHSESHRLWGASQPSHHLNGTSHRSPWQHLKILPFSLWRMCEPQCQAQLHLEANMTLQGPEFTCQPLKSKTTFSSPRLVNTTRESGPMNVWRVTRRVDNILHQSVECSSINHPNWGILSIHSSKGFPVSFQLGTATCTTRVRK